MRTTGYLWRLAEQLANGLGKFPEEDRTRHRAFLHKRQNPDGGFSGREGDSDLYYTGFALRALVILEGLTPDVGEKAAQFLRLNREPTASVIEVFSRLYAGLLVQLSGAGNVFEDGEGDWLEQVPVLLEQFAAPDGGYGKVTGAASGSTYHTFLAGLCYQLLGRDLPDSGKILHFLVSRRRQDGGFVEIAPMSRSGTNPTAAAVGLLQILEDQGGHSDIFPAQFRQGVVDFLLGMWSAAEGGLRANTRAPLADLLSTFTGAWTLAQLGALDRVDSGALGRYLYSLERPEGGFRGGVWDETTDVEYTFYGLGVRALLEKGR
jgi:geranylgeranyl transferase type-2 subunit beta